jgi:hypothetical protein
VVQGHHLKNIGLNCWTFFFVRIKIFINHGRQKHSLVLVPSSKLLTLLCCVSNTSPELLNSEPALDSLLFQLLELNWELEYEQVNTSSWLTYYSSAGGGGADSICKCHKSLNPLCAEEMRGSNHFSLLVLAIKANRHTSQFAVLTVKSHSSKNLLPTCKKRSKERLIV